MAFADHEDRATFRASDQSARQIRDRVEALTDLLEPLISSGTLKVSIAGGQAVIQVDLAEVDVQALIAGIADGKTLADLHAALTGSLAVSGPLTDAELRAVAVPVSAAALPLPAGAATAAGQDSIIALLGGSLEPSYVPVALAAAGRAVLAAGEAGKIPRLHHLFGTVTAPGTQVQLRYDDDGAGTNEVALTGPMDCDYKGHGFVLAWSNWRACPKAPVGKYLTLVTVTGGFNGGASVSKSDT